MKKILLFIPLLALFSYNSVKKSDKPNVILFFIDDMGSMDLSCYGNTFNQTPNIDNLAKHGVEFTNAYSVCTFCSPSRAALMTGKYPANLHIIDWIAGHIK